MGSNASDHQLKFFRWPTNQKKMCIIQYKPESFAKELSLSISQIKR